MVNKINLVSLKDTPILQQLAMEEALLRCDHENWCIINEGSPSAIVMGIGSKIDDVIAVDQLKTINIPVIRRFSGGGTVVVDDKTLFISFIFQNSSHQELTTPRAFMKWTEDFYNPIFQPHDFRLIENDYVIGTKKIGGNAQYFTKKTSLHHTTFLWDFNKNLMKLLKLPPIRPQYREKREHDDFLDKLKEYFPSIESVSSKIRERLSHYFQVDTSRVDEIPTIMKQSHRKALKIVDI